MSDIVNSVSEPSAPSSIVALDFSHLESFETLSDIQRSVISIYMASPRLTKKEIQERVGCPLSSVYAVLHSKAFERVALEVGEREKMGMVPLAVERLRRALNSQDENVSLKAAIRILEDVEILKKAPTQKTENQMVVLWGNDQKSPITEVIEQARSLTDIDTCS